MSWGYLQPNGALPTSVVVSGGVASGSVASGSVHGFFGPVRNIASGTVGVFDFGSGAVVAGSVGSGAVVSGNIASGQLGSFHIASGRLTGFELGSGSIVSGRIASGQLGYGHLASGANAFTNSDLFNTVELISGFAAVCLTSGNVIALAQAGSGLCLPAIGVVKDNFVSGALATVFYAGQINAPATAGALWSGQAGRPVYVGSGGAVQAGGLMVSGQGWQRMGIAVSGGVIVNVNAAITSGALTTPAGAF